MPTDFIGVQPPDPSVRRVGQTWYDGVNLFLITATGFTSLTGGGGGGAAGGYNVINVTSAPYNAVGDGVADDTVALDAAYAAANPGDVVYFPRGTYKRTTSWVVTKNNIIFRGDNRYSTTIKFTGYNGHGFRLGDNGVTAYSGIVIEDLTLDGSGMVADVQQNGVFFSGLVTLSHIRRCKITSWAKAGVRAGLTGANINNRDNIVFSCEIDTCFNGIRFSLGADRCIAAFNKISNCGTASVGGSSGGASLAVSTENQTSGTTNNALVVGNEVRSIAGAGARGFDLSGNAVAGAIVAPVDFARVIGNFIDGATHNSLNTSGTRFGTVVGNVSTNVTGGDCIHLADDDRMVIADNICFNAVRSGTSGGGGIKVLWSQTSATGITGGGKHIIKGNLIQQTEDVGIGLQISPTSSTLTHEHCVIEGNTIIGASQAAAAAVGGINIDINAPHTFIRQNVVLDTGTSTGVKQGLKVTTGGSTPTTNLVIADNFFADTRVGGARGQQNGVVLASGNNDCQITGNYFKNHIQSGIQVNTATDLLIANNHVVSNGTDGILIQTSSDRCSLENNVLKANGRDGIRNVNCNKLTVSGNKFLDNTNFGYREITSATANEIIGNYFDGNGSGTMLILDQSTRAYHNRGFNQPITSGVSVGASPFTYTVSGNRPEVLYVNAGSGVFLQVSGGGGLVTVASGVPATLRLEPAAIAVINYAGVPVVISEKQ